ncbi:MAG: transglutaminase family protein [Ferruginibacter sp.]
MQYSITHNTTYKYNEIVNLCHNIAILSPRNTDTQTCHSFNIIISPVPQIMESYEDFYGNKVSYFVVEQEHAQLSVTALSVVEKKAVKITEEAISKESWESVRDTLIASSGDFLYEKQFTTATEITVPSEAIKEYAALSFTPGRPMFEAVHDQMKRIYKDFAFTPDFTTVSTPLSVVMEERKGVCQDFAHLGIACLHSVGLPARYISGYLETLPPPGKPKLTGVDASHAWFSAFIPGMGWVDFDPTNNQLPGEQYITIGWGRNYFDIIPLRGIIMSNNGHELKVSVDVRRLSAS